MENDESFLTNSRVIVVLSDSHSVFLVQRSDNNKLYVKKELSIYNTELYEYLRDHPIPNTPKICAVFEENERLIVFEEYISGDTLEEILSSRETLDRAETIGVTKQLCVIVQCLHESVPPIIHRDIKPSNIIITSDGTVKLLDMNAAKWVRNDVSRDTSLIGTVGYAAPEQYGFGASSIQTDIYAIGVLMNVMLTGAYPNEKLADAPMAAIVKKCTQMDPQMRYQSALQLADALDTTIPDKIPQAASSWRLPGFRAKTPSKMILAAMGYLVILAAGMTLSVKTNSVVDLWLNRVFFIGLLLTEVLFWGDYRGIDRKVGLRNISNRWLRLCLKAVYSGIYFLAVMVVLVVIENVLF